MRHLVVALAMALLLVPSPAAGGGSAPFAYLSNTGGNNVLAVDTVSATVTPVGVGKTTYGVAVDAQGKRAYVTDNSNPGKLYAIDVATKQLIGTVAVGKMPYGVAVTRDGSRVFVANILSNSVSVIDPVRIGTSNPPVVDTLPAGSLPWGVVVSPDGGQIYVTNVSGSVVTAIDPVSRTIRQVPSDGGTPSGLALYGTHLYVTDYTGNRVWVIDTTRIGSVGAIINRVSISVGPQPYAVAVNRDGTRAYVTNSESNTVSVLDISSLGSEFVTAKVTVGSRPHGVAMASDGSRAYVANNGGRSLSVINVATNEVTTIPLPANSVPIAFGPFVFGTTTIHVRIDVVPPVVNRKAQGTVPVKIFSSDGKTDPNYPEFYVQNLTIDDLKRIRLNGLSVKIKPNDEPMFEYGDFDGDGLEDVMVHFSMDGAQDALAAASDSTATLEGQTSDGMSFEGTDSVKFLH